MKKLISLLLCLSVFAVPAAFAEDEATSPIATAVAEDEATSPIATAVAEAVQDKPVQGVEVEKSGGVIVFQKQPQTETSTQYVKVHKCGLVAIILLNGKVKEEGK